MTALTSLGINLSSITRRLCLFRHQNDKKLASTLLRAVQIAIISGTACIVHANNVADGWLQVLPGFVQGVFLDAGNGEAQPQLKINTVVVVTSAANDKQESTAKSRLFTFSNGKELLTPGCLFWNLDAVEKNQIRNSNCDRLRIAAQRKFVRQFQMCRNLTSENYQAYLFATNDLGSSRCLVKQNTSQDIVASTGDAGVWLKSRLEIENRLRGRTDEIDVMGQYAYLRIEGDKIFNCPKLGTPTTYRAKKMSEELAKVDIKELFKKYSSGQYAELRRDPSQIFFELPTWQKQYLIKTHKFAYACWNATRSIDQPEEVGLLLDDNTALLVGSVSVLRIRLIDGGTDASKKIARVFDAPVISASIKRLEDSCPDTCQFANIGGYKSVDRTNTTPREPAAMGIYYRHVIQGIDRTLQTQFSQSITESDSK